MSTDEGLKLLDEIQKSSIKHLDHKLIGALCILSPDDVKEAFNRIKTYEAAKENGS